MSQQKLMFERIGFQHFNWNWFFLVLFFAIAISVLAYPIALLLLKSFVVSRPGHAIEWGLIGWIRAFSDTNLLIAMLNTFGLAIVRVALTVVLAIFFAWVVTRTDTPFKGFIEFALWLGFFLPMLPMTMGWILLFDPYYGVLNKLIMSVFLLSEPPFNIYSYGGIVWCHLAFSTSIRFILITPAFRNMDAALEEAARVSGSGNFQTLWRITVPVLTPAIVASTFLAFIKSLESFEIELVLGVPAEIYVLSTKIYDFIYWEPPLFGPATALSSIFLFVIFVLVWLQRIYLRGRQYMTVTGRGYTVRPFSLGKWRWLTFGICALFIGVVIFLPLVALVVGTFMKFFGNFNLSDPWTLEHWKGVFQDPLFFRSLVNTFILGAAAAIIGSIIYTLVSYFIVRTRCAGRQFIDFLSWLPWAMPGILISLALLWTVLGSGSVVRLIYGTIWVLILAIIIKEMPVGVQIMKAGLMQISDELEEASMVAGSSWVSTYRRILLPLLKPTVIAVGIVVLMSAIRDIATVIFLATSSTRTTSLLMLDYMAEANMERAAVVAVVIVGLIFCLLFLGRLIGYRHVSVQS